MAIEPGLAVTTFSGEWAYQIRTTDVPHSIPTTYVDPADPVSRLTALVQVAEQVMEVTEVKK